MKFIQISVLINSHVFFLQAKDKERFETTEKVDVQKTALQNRGKVVCFILK